MINVSAAVVVETVNNTPSHVLYSVYHTLVGLHKPGGKGKKIVMGGREDMRRGGNIVEIMIGLGD